jgi:hypothetical protein
VSWNGVSTGLETSSLRPPRASGPTTMERVTVVARRVVRQKMPLAPFVAVAMLGITAGLWRAVSSASGGAVTSSQTILAAPGPDFAPSVDEALALAASDGVRSETGATADVDAITVWPEAISTAFAERELEAAVRVPPARRPVPLARPKPAANSTANEPDVGF